MTYYSQRFHTSSLLDCRDLPVRRYVVAASYLLLEGATPLIMGWRTRWVSTTRVVRARHEMRARLAYQAWLEFRSGRVMEPGSLRLAAWPLDRREGARDE